MSMEHCEKHGRNFDTDFDVECPECEAEIDLELSNVDFAGEPDGEITDMRRITQGIVSMRHRIPAYTFHRKRVLRRA
mgnify:CR=1 FL=1